MRTLPTVYILTNWPAREVARRRSVGRFLDQILFSLTYPNIPMKVGKSPLGMHFNASRTVRKIPLESKVPSSEWFERWKLKWLTLFFSGVCTLSAHDHLQFREEMRLCIGSAMVCRFVALAAYRLQSPASRTFLLFLFSIFPLFNVQTSKQIGKESKTKTVHCDSHPCFHFGNPLGFPKRQEIGTTRQLTFELSRPPTPYV